MKKHEKFKNLRVSSRSYGILSESIVEFVEMNGNCSIAYKINVKILTFYEYK
jgi:hypothetical protein